jgi:NADH oxidase (H2O2-forming)
MKYDVVIIGGGPSGIQTALSARQAFPNKTIALIRREEIALQIGALPHALSSLDSLGECTFPDLLLTQRDVEILLGEVASCQPSMARLHDSREVRFDRLVLAVGGRPKTLNIEGINQPGVFRVTREYQTLKSVREALKTARSILIIGGGFTGIELCNELIRLGKDIALVESEPFLLPGLVDQEYAQIVKDELVRTGVQVTTGCPVRSLVGKRSVLGADLADGRWVTADLVLLAQPFQPDIRLAQGMGLRCDPERGVFVDEYLRTSAPDIYAVGQCAAGRSFFSAERQRTTLTSEAMAQARLAGANLFAINVAKSYAGSLGSFACAVGSLVLGVTGLTEHKAAAIGLDYVVGRAETIDRHPARLAGANRVLVKLLFERSSRHLVGAQALGGESTGECVNMLAVMVQKRITDMDIDTLQLGTHPRLTPSPLGYGVMGATVDAVRNWSSYAQRSLSGRATTEARRSPEEPSRNGVRPTPRQG